MVELFSNNKGMVDIIVAVVALFMVAIVVIIAVFIGNTIFPELKEKMNNEDVNYTINKADIAVDQFPTATYLMLFIALAIGLIITSFLLDNHPIFLVGYIVLIPIIMLVSVALSNAYQKFTAASTTLGSTAASYPIVEHLMGYLPWYTAGLIIITGIVIFSKGVLKKEVI